MHSLRDEALIKLKSGSKAPLGASHQTEIAEQIGFLAGKYYLLHFASSKGIIELYSVIVI